MAKNQANSNQIKDGAILSRHIKEGEVLGTHVALAAIESKHIALGAVTDDHLSIDWAAKASAILQSKLVVDYVQAQAVAVASASASVTVTTAISAPLSTVDSPKGVVVDSGKNIVIIRSATDSTEPIRDTDGEEVKGHITHDGTDFVINFYTNKAGVETPFEFSADTSIVFQYPQRFDFESVSEMFGANEKFVDYGVDVSTRFDINQLAADIFGDTYALTGTGEGSNAISLIASVEAHAEAIAAIEISINSVAESVDAVEAKADANAEAIVSINASIDSLAEGISELDVAVSDTTKTIERMDDEIVDIKTSALLLARRVKEIEDTPADTSTGSSTLKRNDKKFTEQDLENDDFTFEFTAIETELPLTGDFDVYYNGMLQMSGVHYRELSVVDGRVLSITFEPDAIVAGDVVQARWFV